MISGGEDQSCVSGLQCVGCVSKSGWTSLGYNTVGTKEGARRPTDQDRRNQSDK